MKAPRGPLRGGLPRRPLRFAAAGAANTALDLSVFSLLLAAGAPLAGANAAGWLCGALCSFGLNRGWTFAPEPGDGRARAPVRAAAPFLAASAAGLGLSHAAVVLLAPALGAHPAKLVACALVAAWNWAAASRVLRPRRLEA